MSTTIPARTIRASKTMAMQRTSPVRFAGAAVSCVAVGLDAMYVKREAYNKVSFVDEKLVRDFGFDCELI